MSTSPNTDTTEVDGGTSELESLYTGIPVSTLVIGTVVPFDLFTEIDDSALLYRGAGDKYTREQRKAFTETDMGDLLVRREDLGRYYEYLGGNLMVLLKGSPGEKPEPRDIHDTSVMIAGQAIELPSSRPAFDMACQVIDNAVDMTSQAGGVLGCVSAGAPGRSDLHSHSMRVCFYGLQLARGLEIEDEQELSDLGVGLMLHDLGKVRSKGVEWTEPEDLRDHPHLGLERIRDAGFVGPIARDVIEHHHERLDGHGLYGCDGAEISIFARIAAVADTFDRRTVDGLSNTVSNSFDALRTMIAEDKGAYDPRVLANFVRAMSL